MVSLDKASRRYGHFEAVRDITFTAQAGEVVGLLGQNGAGKSTIMNMLAGCLAPSGGRVTINGFDMQRQPMQARRSVGYLPEIPPLYPEMTVREYLVFCCQIKQLQKKDIKRHTDELMELSGLTEVRDQLIGQLSKGYRQRAGLAQALCGDPEVLLLDEPAAGFDPMQAVAFRKLIRKLAPGRTIIFSSHLLSEVQEVCDRVLILHRGELKLDHHLDAERQADHYRLLVRGAPEKLLPPIRQLASVRRVRSLDSRQQGLTSLLVETLAGGQFPEQLFTLLSGLGAPILELSPVGDSLEALFLRVTAQEEQSA